MFFPLPGRKIQDYSVPYLCAPHPTAGLVAFWMLPGGPKSHSDRVARGEKDAGRTGQGLGNVLAMSWQCQLTLAGATLQDCRRLQLIQNNLWEQFA